METIYSDLKQLGGQTELPDSPEQAVIERVANSQADVAYCVRFTAPEFTSLCPMTGQPDFAHLVIDYVPGDWLVESKSLKLFLGSFRNHGAFHEDCTISIARKHKQTGVRPAGSVARFHQPQEEPHRHHDHCAQCNIAEEIAQRIEDADKGAFDKVDQRADQLQRLQLECRQHKADHQRQNDQPDGDTQRRIAKKAVQSGAPVVQGIWIGHSEPL